MRKLTDMDTSKLFMGTIAGTITSLIAGFLIFGLALSSYMTDNMVGIEGELWHWVIIGHVFLALLLTYIYAKWAGISTAMSGLKAGLIIGLLVCLGYNFLMLGTTGLFTGGLSTAIIDAVGGMIIWGAGGAGVGWALGRGAS